MYDNLYPSRIIVGADLAERINAYQKTWDIAGFIDDNVKLHGQELNGIQVVGDCTYFQNLQEKVSVILAVGSPRIKKQLAGQLSQYDHVEFATLIDPSVIMSEHIENRCKCCISKRRIVR